MEKEKIIGRHLNHEVHEKIMEWLECATNEEIFKTSVEAGIYDDSGELAEEYR
jgi:light-regulated signal transduction histidine kinase (bacteriophytochrome)